MVKSFDQCERRYGKIINGVWADESKWMTVFTVPEHIASNWIGTLSGKPTQHIYCNKDFVWNLSLALKNLESRGLLSELKTFDGCFSIREVRGATLAYPSTHSYGLALDINASENALGAEPRLSQEFVKCFTNVEFAWGGNFPRKDGMHFSLAWE